MENLHKVWGFVETYFPNYYSSNEIAENDDYQKIVDGEINGDAENMYNNQLDERKLFWGGGLTESEIESEVVEHFQNLLNESNAYILEQAILGYIESQKVGRKFARKCSGTNEGMNCGYVYGDGEQYFKYESDLVSYLRSLGDEQYNEASDEFILSESYAQEEYYWTEWQDEDDFQYELINGILTEIE